MNTPATKATTPCPTSSPRRGPTNRPPRRRQRRPRPPPRLRWRPLNDRRRREGQVDMKLRNCIAAGLGGAVLAVFTAGGPALAHHAFAAEFDGKAPVLLRGKVSKVEWINPHAWVHLMIEEPGKPAQEWMVEGGTPNTLLR